MGKSPGKWIKAVLFGKKQSKSRSSKNATTPDKKVSLATTAEDHVLDKSPTNHVSENGASYARLENGTAPAPSTPSSGGNQLHESQVVAVPLNDAEMLIQNQSATKAQAAFKGYLARRAFRALKGIIRLQALIRGHLVRRQAIATFYSMQAILKLQAAVRGWNAGASDKYNAGDLQATSYGNAATNSYIRKLLRSVPTATPLALQYEETEPNSASVWLERWSRSRFWVPVLPRKETAGNHSVKSRRTSRRADNAQNGDNGDSASNGIDAKRNMRKSSSRPADWVQKQPQSKPKIKRNLRKVSASVAAASEKGETIIEQPESQSPEESMNPVIGHEAAPRDEAFEVSENGLSRVGADPLENGTESKHEQMEEISAKPEFNESPSQNTTPSLPSYMAATQSAKARLRASGSPKVAEGGSHIRRHSLPTSANGKSASVSPAPQPPNTTPALKTNKQIKRIQ